MRLGQVKAGECLVLSNDSVFVNDDYDGTIVRIPKHGGPAVTFNAGPSSTDALLVYGGDLFWNDGPAIRKKALTGGGTDQLVVTGASDLEGLFADTDGIFFSEYQTGGIARVSTSGGSAQAVSTSDRPTKLTADASNVYWCSSTGATGGIFTAPKSGGPAVQLASGEGPLALVLAGDVIVWLNAAPPAVEMTPTAGGPTTTLVALSPQATPTTLALDGDAVVWSEFGSNPMNSRVRRVALAGGDPTTVATGSDLRGVATDADAIYWTTNDQQGTNEVFKIAKSP